MKSICTFAICLLLSAATSAQGNQKEEKIKDHEKIIWAGTGIDLNDKSKDAKNVPDAVMASFRQFFPDQPIDNVRKYRGMYAITFSNSVYTTTLLYKANGTFLEARTVATNSTLPQAIVERVKQSKSEFAGNETVVIEKANKEKLYRVHLKKHNGSEYVVYNEAAEEVKYDY